MSEAALPAASVAPMPGRMRLFWRSFAENRGAVIGLAIMVLLLLLAVSADVVSPHSPIRQFREHFLTPPAWQVGGSTEFLLGTVVSPRHPYTAALLKALPERAPEQRRLATIPGVVPGIDDRPTGCVFHPRCGFSTDLCTTQPPAVTRGTSGHVRCHFPVADLAQCRP